MEKLQILEEKIMQIIDKSKALIEENKALNEKTKKLQEELKQKSIKQDSATIDKLKVQINRFESERETARVQVEGLLEELESVEL